MADGNSHAGGSEPSLHITRSAGLDQFLTVLADARRRDIVRVLADQDRGVSAGELVAGLLDGREREGCHLRTELRHRHLPRLEESAFIRRDEDGTIYPTERCVSAVDVLESIEGHMSRSAVM